MYIFIRLSYKKEQMIFEVNVSGPFGENEEYLVVADYNQENVYQLKPDSGEVRAIPMRQCKPVSLAFDPSIDGVYVICLQNNQYFIHEKTFDGKIDKIIYNVSRSKLARNIVFCLLVMF